MAEGDNPDNGSAPRKERAKDSKPSEKSVGTADRGLLFGIVAVQMNFIRREGLISGMKAWVLNKQRALGEILVELKLMQPEHRQMLEPLVAAYIEQYDNDPQQCLAALSSITSIKAELDRLQDPELTVIFNQVAESQAPKPASEGKPPRTSKEPEIRFRILRPHAKGGLGQVSVALDKELNREVALKEIQKKHLGDSASRERFVLEAEITGGLQHPGIVPVYGLGQFPDGSPFYAMRFIRGDSLKDAIEEYHQPDRRPRRSPTDRRLELRKLLGRFIDVCNAMEYAHSRGVLHRDLKPGNIMLGKYGETLVVDWGLAKALGQNVIESDEPTLVPSSAMSSSGQTRAGAALGTPAYMSPEQAAGKLDELGPETDVYSLGATMYHLLTGKPPFAGKPLDVLKLVKAGDFVRPGQVAAETPPALEAICLKAMSLKPRNRYSSPRLMAEDLERWLADEPVQAHSETWSERLTRLERKHRSWVRAGTASLAVIAVLSVIAALWINVERNEKSKLAASEATAKTNAQKEKVVAEAASADALKAKGIADTERARADQNAKDAIRRADELQIQLAKTHFQHGVAEYESGHADIGVKDLATAWKLLPKTHELRAAYEQVLVDRIMYGGRAIPLHGGTYSPDRSRWLGFAFKDGKNWRQIYDGETMSPVGSPLTNSDGFLGLVEFSENNQRVIGTSYNNSVRVWDAKTGLLTGQLSGHESKGMVRTFSPDGERCVWHSDKIARLWDLKTNSQLGKPLEHQGVVGSSAFSPNGLQIVTASQDGSARLWDGLTGVPLGEIMRPCNFPMAFSLDSTHLVTGSTDKAARVWDGRTGKPLSNPLVHDSKVVSVAFSPDGITVVTAAGNSGRLWEWHTGTRIGESMLQQEEIQSVDFSPDGTRVATGSFKGMTRIWNARTGTSVAEPLRLGMGARAKFQADSRRLNTENRMNTENRSWEVFPNQPIAELTNTEFLSHLKFSSDGKRILTIGNPGVRIHEFDAITYARLAEFHRDERGILLFALSKDGKRFATASNIKKGTTNGTYTQQVYLWDAETKVSLGVPMEHPQSVKALAFSPDGVRLATACGDGGVRLWNGLNGTLIGGPLGDGGSVEGKFGTVVNCVAFSPDGGRLAIGTQFMTYIADASTLKVERVLEKLSGAHSLAFSPDGSRLVTAIAIRTAQLWDIQTGAAIGEPMRHGSSLIPNVAFSPDGTFVVTASDGQTVRLWDGWTGVPLREPFPHPGIVFMAFSPDGTRLMTSGTDKTLRVWDTAPLPRPKNLPNWISTLSGVDVREAAPATAPPNTQVPESEPFTQREAEWYAAVRQRQDRNCRLFQVSAAREAEGRKDWFAAEFHLQHLLQAEPDNEQLKTRLQTARDELKKSK